MTDPTGADLTAGPGAAAIAAAPADGARAALTVPYRVRFDESTPDGSVRTSTLLRYAQDCAWVHSERLGFGREWYAERDLSWLVRAIRLMVHGQPSTGARLSVTTRVIGFRRVMARRLTTIVDEGGAPVADVHTDWVLTELRRGAPTRVPDDFPRLFSAPPGGFEPCRVLLGSTPAEAVRTRFDVRPHDLDPMAHANNAAYLDWLEACVLPLPDGPSRLRALPRTVVLEYLQPARPGAMLEGAVWRDGPGVAHRLVHGETELLRARLDPGAPGGAGGTPGGEGGAPGGEGGAPGGAGGTRDGAGGTRDGAGGAPGGTDPTAPTR